MDSFLVLALGFTLATVVSAQYSDARSQYGPPAVNAYLPQQQNDLAYGPPSTTPEPPRDLKVFRHVFVHSAPNDGPQESQIRKIKGPGGDTKHVSIIFVKAPAPAAPDQQVVDIPNDGGRKTLVYVLLKKAADSPDVKFSGPAPTKPSKPEVYFIRYKDQTTTTSAPPSNSYGAPAQDSQSGYGAPQPPLPVFNKGSIAPAPNGLSGYA